MTRRRQGNKATRQRGNEALTLRRCLTLVEMIVCTLIVSVMLLAALNAVGAARLNECRLAEDQRALLLAQDLMAEILCQPYSAADEPGDLIGTAAADRTGFNSVGDYNGWRATPPEDRDGSVIPNSEGYTRAVRVVWVNPDNLELESASSTGVKCIQVSIERDSRPVAVLTGYRTAVWKDPAQTQGGGS